MNKLAVGVSLLLICVLAGFAIFQRNSAIKRAEENQTLRQQLEDSRAENGRLVNELAQASNSPALADDQLTELLRLRNEVTMLRSQTNRVEASPSRVSDPVIHELQIVSARYGSGTNVVDVTARVIELLHREASGFTARADWMNIDPAPYKNKTLVVIYNYAGKQNIFTAAGGEKVSYDLLLTAAAK